MMNQFELIKNFYKIDPKGKYRPSEDVNKRTQEAMERLADVDSRAKRKKGQVKSSKYFNWATKSNNHIHVPDSPGP